MTRKQTQNKLKDIQKQLKSYPDSVAFGDKRLFKFWWLLWEEHALEMSLQYNKDLDSVIHPNEFIEGKGKKLK